MSAVLARAVGARLAFICIDEDAELASRRMQVAVQEASDAGLLAGCMRITVGTPEENGWLVDALKAALA